MEPLDSTSLEVGLRTIINQLGHLLDVDYCVFSPFNSHYSINKIIFYNKKKRKMIIN